MKRTARVGKALPLLLALGILLLGGQVGSPIQRTTIQTELTELKDRGFEYRILDNSSVEITRGVTDFKRIKTLQEPSEATIREWAASRGIPILEIDPATIDTNLYAGRYRYWTQIPITADIGSRPVVGDFDRDGRAEVYGLFKEYSMFDPLARIYEVDSAGSGILQHTYLPFPGVVEGTADIDKNGRLEIYWTRSYVKRFFEQSSLSSLPTDSLLAYSTIVQNTGVNSTSPVVGFIDGDSLTDILYYGTFPDSADTTEVNVGLSIAELDSSSTGFRRVWSEPYMTDVLGGLTVGDFDNDGRKEFCCSFARGNVIVHENSADNNYLVVWQDSVPLVNFIHGVSGDVDGDGTSEFFRGATMGNGNWTLTYEADGNNQYSPRFLFHLLSGGGGDYPDYHTVDLDGDGGLELIIFSGSTLYVFKSNGDNSYYLSYLKREDRRDGIQFYDFNGDGKRDLIIGKTMSNGTSLRYYSDIYLADRLTEIKEPDTPLPNQSSLSQNYPNPFNPSTTIKYRIAGQQYVRLIVFDILGKEIATLKEGIIPSGEHSATWNPSNYAAGVFFYRLEAGGTTITKKMALIR